MTTDTQLAPTDAELTAIYRAANGEDTGKAQPLTTQRIFRAMRAAISKWGQPAHSGEPAYAFRRRGQDDFCTCTLKRYKELSDFPEKFEMRIFYTAPQPTQAQAGAVPLTDEQILNRENTGSNPGTAAYDLDLARFVEAAHGIKGGQHGNE